VETAFLFQECGTDLDSLMLHCILLDAVKPTQ